ncbi:MAG: methionine--tRNA ligase [Nitrososphaerota archaeon]|nr:methionine--tRNA ligase [Nitrososphaerota archaeon]
MLITAALPYSYAPRHFGHLSGAYLPADIFARFMRMLGHEVLFVCGTDENASSIVLEAMKKGMTPQQLCDMFYPIQRDTFAKLGISFDIFSRTSKKIHYDTVYEFYTRLWEKGYIYRKRIKQWYCPKDDKVLPDRFVKGTCPICGAPDQYGEVCEVCASWYEANELIDPVCTLCGNKPIIIEKDHYFLKLSALTQKVLEYVKPKKFWRKSTYNKTTSWLENEGLKDKDITRDYDWGPPAPFPGAEGQVLYNWVENLLGYISATKDWSIQVGQPDAWKKFWLDPETRLYCFIGKDNLFFHTILFPAILIAHGDYVLPYNVVVNEFVNLEGQKLSTSRGWVIWLHEMLESYEPDLIRYYAAIIAPETKDSDFRWKDFQAKINNELVATLGNFVHRVLLFVHTKFEGVVPEPGELEPQDRELLNDVEKLTVMFKNRLENCRFKSGLKIILELAQLGNRYLNTMKPWAITENAARAMYVAMQVVKALCVLMSPYLPFSAHKLMSMINLNLTPETVRWEELSVPIKPQHKINKPEPLFRKVTDEEISKYMSKLSLA